MASSPTSSTWERAKSDFASAYDKINQDGTVKTATAGKYALKDVGAGVVQVTDETRGALGRAGGDVSDAWITTKVKTELARTPGVESDQIRVTTDRGVVRLIGTVPNPAAAERAINRAIDVKGVDAVDADLKYPRQSERSDGAQPHSPPRY